MSENKIHIQFWTLDHAIKPSREDLLRTLHLCLAFMADSIDLSLAGLRSSTPEKQLTFWRAFIALDEETDFASVDTAERWEATLNSFCDSVSQIIEEESE